MWDGINRRRFPRANYKCKIVIRNKGDASKVFATHTENIGVGGISVLIKEGIDLFRNVELELLLEDTGPTVKCDGSIVWVVKKSDPANKGDMTFDTGVEFSNLKQADRERIGKIVDLIISSS